MGATCVLWRTTTAVIITILQIRALISVKTTVVRGVEGQRFDFRCEYPNGQKSSAKYLCHVDDNESSSYLIRTDKHNQWETDGRFSLYDNTTAGFFIVRVDELNLDDSGTYWCGVDISNLPDHISVIQLNVSQVRAIPALPMDALDKLHLPLYLAAVMCVAAMLFVCLFTVCLLLAVKHKRSGPRQIREASSDYETMVPGVMTEPELCCSCQATVYTDLSASPSPPPPPDYFCPHIASKLRESVVSLGLGEYVDVDVPGHICQYQHLDLSQLEEHVYHGLHGNNDPKNGPAKEQINC